MQRTKDNHKKLIVFSSEYYKKYYEGVLKARAQVNRTSFSTELENILKRDTNTGNANVDSALSLSYNKENPLYFYASYFEEINAMINFISIEKEDSLIKQMLVNSRRIAEECNAFIPISHPHKYYIHSNTEWIIKIANSSDDASIIKAGEILENNACIDRITNLPAYINSLITLYDYTWNNEHGSISNFKTSTFFYRILSVALESASGTFTPRHFYELYSDALLLAAKSYFWKNDIEYSCKLYSHEVDELKDVIKNKLLEIINMYLHTLDTYLGEDIVDNYIKNTAYYDFLSSINNLKVENIARSSWYEFNRCIKEEYIIEAYNELRNQ